MAWINGQWVDDDELQGMLSPRTQPTWGGSNTLPFYNQPSFTGPLSTLNKEATGISGMFDVPLGQAPTDTPPTLSPATGINMPTYIQGYSPPVGTQETIDNMMSLFPVSQTDTVQHLSNQFTPSDNPALSRLRREPLPQSTLTEEQARISNLIETLGDPSSEVTDDPSAGPVTNPNVITGPINDPFAQNIDMSRWDMLPEPTSAGTYSIMPNVEVDQPIATGIVPIGGIPSGRFNPAQDYSDDTAVGQSWDDRFPTIAPDFSSGDFDLGSIEALKAAPFGWAKEDQTGMLSYYDTYAGGTPVTPTLDFSDPIASAKYIATEIAPRMLGFTLKICLTKIDDTLPDLKLPFIKLQLILRKFILAKEEEVIELTETERGGGGFGSTDKKWAEPYMDQHGYYKRFENNDYKNIGC